MEQNLVRRKCDYCDHVMEFQNNRSVDQVSPTEAEEVSSWITLVKVHFIKQRNQAYPVQKHACRQSCAENIIKLHMLELPQEILDTLAEERRLQEEMQKKIADAQAKQAAAEAGVDTPLPTVAEA